MKYDFDAIEHLLNEIAKQNYWEAISEEYTKAELDVPHVFMTVEGVNLSIVKNRPPFEESNVAPLNPALNRSTWTMSASWGGTNIGHFTLTEDDFSTAAKESVDETIISSITSVIKGNYFWEWYHPNITPFFSHDVPLRTTIEMIQRQLNNFGIEIIHSFDGSVLLLQAYASDPFKVLWSLQQINNVGSVTTLSERPKSMVSAMAYDVFSHLFFDVARGMGTSYEPGN